MSETVELTTAQARVARDLRRRWPRGTVVSHLRAWGVILEVRVGERTVELLALTADGRVERSAALRRAA